MKVMIADDEKLFRDYLRTLIPWGDYGLRIVAEARNGAEALEQAAEHKPDIALIDINMPVMDGLALTERLREASPDTAVVLITGHNEFEYARQAIRLGVEDYILKPFTKEELLLTLLKLQADVQREQEERLTIRESETLARELILNRLITGELVEDGEALAARLASWGAPHRSGMFQAASIEIDRMDKRWLTISDRELWKFAVTNILNEAMQVQGNHLVFNGPEGRIICIYELAESEAEGLADAGSLPAAGMSGYLEGCEQLIFLIRKYLRFDVTIGIGRIYAGYGGIQSSYQEALEALRSKFVVGSGRVIACGESGGARSGIALSPQANESLTVMLRMQDEAGLRSKLHELFAGLRENRLSIEYVYVMCLGLISTCLAAVSEQGHPIEDCFGEDFYPYSEIMQKSSIDEAAVWIEELFLKAAAYIRMHRQTKSAKIAETAREFIDARFADPELKVEHIAQHVYINPSYLRAVFKKAHGITVMDYLTQRRMEQARQLLGTGNRKLAEIAERVGYNDPAYFSRAFKKYYGYSPTEYENSRTRE